MKLTRLEIIDFKRISAAAIDANGTPIVLTGDNGQGKTSVLDAIGWVLTRTGTEQPIRNGAESTTVAVKLSDGETRNYTVKRKQKGQNSYLDITSDDGSKMPSPQKFLDSLVGSLAFDPEAFTRLKPKEQANELRAAVGLDTSDLDQAYKTAFAQRTEANRAKDNAEKVFKSCPVVSSQPLVPKDAAALVAERDALNQRISMVQVAEQNLIDCNERIRQCNESIAILEEKLRIVREALMKNEDDQKAYTLSVEKRNIEALNADERIVEIHMELAGINEHNAKITEHNRAIDDRKAKEEAYRSTLSRASDLDAEVKRIQAEKEARIAAANFPVPGLTIEDDVVMVNNVPFSDLNTAERIKVSTLIAMSQNPGLKVIFVREGALVSRANLAVLTDLAEQHGMTVWIEKFSEQPEENSIHIEDGHISYVNGQPAEAQQLTLV